MKKQINKYKFEFKHIAILFIVLIAFEIALFFIFKNSLSSFIINNQQWYQEYSANRIADYTASSFEMLLETVRLDEDITPTERSRMIQKFDLLLNQQYLEKDIEEICLFIKVENNFKVVDNGEVLFNILVERNKNIPLPTREHKKAEELFEQVKDKILVDESIKSIIDTDEEFYNFIPFVPDGEFSGVMYVKSRPDFSSVTNEFMYNYDGIAMVFSILILTGLFFMYLISSNTLNTRDKAQEELYNEKNEHMKEKLNHEKEFVFTKRIYHAHHKAEKIIGFINRDLMHIKGNEEITKRVTKYANFIARIIYDMKWYEPQISTIRNPIFNTNINEVITFMVDNLFLRLSTTTEAFSLNTSLDNGFPVIHVNEFVIWEIIEPLVQNSITHNTDKNVNVLISTKYDHDKKRGLINITDNGKGIKNELLEEQDGIKKIFLEHTSSREENNKNFGYGCFIAFNMAKRCGWRIDAENLDEGGCRFSVIIQH